MPGLSHEQQEVVTQDSVLWFRTLLLYALCEEVRTEGPRTELLLEQPQDPKEYRPLAEVQEKKFMSMWRTSEWVAFKERYNIPMISCDQGAMGHPCKKPTTLAVTMKDMADLHELRCDPFRPQQDRSRMTLQERCSQSKE